MFSDYPLPGDEAAQVLATADELLAMKEAVVSQVRESITWQAPHPFAHVPFHLHAHCGTLHAHLLLIVLCWALTLTRLLLACSWSGQKKQPLQVLTRSHGSPWPRLRSL